MFSQVRGVAWKWHDAWVGEASPQADGEALCLQNQSLTYGNDQVKRIADFGQNLTLSSLNSKHIAIKIPVFCAESLSVFEKLSTVLKNPP